MDSLSPEHYEKLATSDDPIDWLTSFEYRCKQAQRREITYVELVNSLAMMGPNSPEGTLDDDFNIEFPPYYNYEILYHLHKYGLVKKVRRVLWDDLRTGDEEYGNIAQKSYSRWLLSSFLITFPKRKDDVNG